MTALMRVAGWESGVNKVWLTVYTVDWLYMLPLFAPLTKFEKMNPVFKCESTGPCMVTFLLQVFVALHAKMVEGVLLQMFALVRLAGQEFGAKRVSHAVYLYMHSGIVIKLRLKSEFYK